MADRFVSLDAMGRRKSMARPLWEPRSGPCAACPWRRACNRRQQDRFLQVGSGWR